MKNPVTFRGERRPLAEWARLLGLNYYAVRQRLLIGWPVEQAFSIPIGPRGHPVVDLTGQTFGRLEVLRLARVERRNAVWVCRCLECGLVVERLGSRLRARQRRPGSPGACGCRSGETRRAVFAARHAAG